MVLAFSISWKSLPGDEDKEKPSFPDIGQAPCANLVQGKHHPFPPCPDDVVEEGQAFLAWRGWGEVIWWLRECRGTHTHTRPQEGSHLLAGWEVGSTHCPAQACHVGTKDGDEEPDTVQDSWWEEN